jgi:hypothetical protein
MTIRQRWKQTALHNKLVVIIAGLSLIAPVVLAIVQTVRDHGTQSGRPLLHVSPSTRDARVHWDTGEFSPRSEQGGDPFAITVKNIGDRDAINLTLRFVLNLDTAELVKMAHKSELFSGNVSLDVPRHNT